MASRGGCSEMMRSDLPQNDARLRMRCGDVFISSIWIDRCSDKTRVGRVALIKLLHADFERHADDERRRRAQSNPTMC